MNCKVCFNKVKKLIKCPDCDNGVCIKCCRTELLLHKGILKCFNIKCRIQFNEEFIKNNLGNTFVKQNYLKLLNQLKINDIKEKIPLYEKLYLEKYKNILSKHYNYLSELSTISSILKISLPLDNDLLKSIAMIIGIGIHNVSNNKTSYECQGNNLRFCINENNLSEYIRLYNLIINNNVNIYKELNKLFNADETDDNIYKRKCTECNGYIDNLKCTSCNGEICEFCECIKKDNHVCDNEILNTLNLIRKDSIKCPKCFSYIIKIEGCNDMWCSICNTAFDWQTGNFRDVTQDFHNPHYFEYLVKSNKIIVKYDISELIETVEYDYIYEIYEYFRDIYYELHKNLNVIKLKHNILKFLNNEINENKLDKLISIYIKSITIDNNKKDILNKLLNNLYEYVLKNEVNKKYIFDIIKDYNSKIRCIGLEPINYTYDELEIVETSSSFCYNCNNYKKDNHVCYKECEFCYKSHKPELYCFHCDICNNEFIQYYEDKEKHLSYCKFRTFTCELCHNKFDNINTFENHNCYYNCFICNTMFGKSELDKHLSLGYCEKCGYCLVENHKCEECDFCGTCHDLNKICSIYCKFCNVTHYKNDPQVCKKLSLYYCKKCNTYNPEKHDICIFCIICQINIHDNNHFKNHNIQKHIENSALVPL